MSDVTLLRIGILVAGLVLIAAILFFGRPRKAGQGRRLARAGAEEAAADAGERREPTLGEQIESGLAADASAAERQTELFDAGNAGVPASDLGKRGSDEFDKIVTLYLAARVGQKLHGADIVVAAEKAGLTYGHMNIFHRLVERRPEQGPVFSVANIMKPGSFDMADIQAAPASSMAP